MGLAESGTTQHGFPEEGGQSGPSWEYDLLVDMGTALEVDNCIWVKAFWPLLSAVLGRENLIGPVRSPGYHA